MIHREKNELIATCSECESQEYGGTLEFFEFINSLKENGWKIHKEDDVWVHLCPNCTE